MHVFIIASVSKDGYLADTNSQKSTDWTSQEDKRFFVKRTKEAGVIVMGSTTYATIDRPLPERITVVLTRNPEKIRGAKLHIPNRFQVNNLPTELCAVSLTPKELVSELENKGYQELAVCGGANVYTQFMKAKVVNTLYITYEEITFGKGIPLFTEPIILPKPIEVTPLSPTTILKEYRITL